MTIATVLFLFQTLSFLAVVALAVRAYGRRAKPAMTAAANIPFLADDIPVPARKPAGADAGNDSEHGV